MVWVFFFFNSLVPALLLSRAAYFLIWDEVPTMVEIAIFWFQIHITNWQIFMHRKWHTGNQYMVKSAENRMRSNLELHIPWDWQYHYTEFHFFLLLSYEIETSSTYIWVNMFKNFIGLRPKLGNAYYHILLLSFRLQCSPLEKV